MTAVEERKWPAWKVCYFLFTGALLASGALFVLDLLFGWDYLWFWDGVLGVGLSR